MGKADLSPSCGSVMKVETCPGELLTNHVDLALDLILGSSGRSVVMVVDNCGIEIMSDLILVDTMLRILGIESVTLHVKDSPAFVSDVTEKDMRGVISSLASCNEMLASRLRCYLDEGRLRVLSDSFYTSPKFFWQMPARVEEECRNSALVIVKGDANYRRLVGDRHWRHDTDFADFMHTFWPSDGLVSLRTCKSAVGIGIPKETEAMARKTNPKGWLTSGVSGQVSVYSRSGMELLKKK